MRPSGRSILRSALGGVAALAGLYGYEAAKYRRTSAQGFDLADPPQPGSPEFARLLEALTAAPLRQGNRVRVLRNGCQIFPAMLEAIEGARETVNFATYVYWTGGIAQDVARALRDRARAGVEVNVLLDAVGAAKMDRKLVASLEGAGATVAWFRPPRWYTVSKLDNRTHRKLLIVDGEVGFTGGVGIADEWTGDCEDPDHWRDTHVRVEGPGARDLLGGFLDNWSEATGRILTGNHVADLRGHPDGVRVQVTRSTTEKGATDAEQLFYAAIVGARDRLWITSAYFAPRRAFVHALLDAVERGVDVRVLTNGPHTDKRVVRQAGRRIYGPLLAAGVRIFEYQRTMLHAKALVADGRWSSIGSINMDNRSMALNDELNISIWDEGVSAELERHFGLDVADAKEITHGDWKARPGTERASELASALLKREL